MHFKCLYINKRNSNVIEIEMHRQVIHEGQSEREQPMIELTERKESINSDGNNPSEIKSSIEPDIHRETSLSVQGEAPRSLTYNGRDGSIRIEYKIENMECPCQKPRPLLQVLDIMAIVGMVGLGGFIMVDGFISVITGQGN